MSEWKPIESAPKDGGNILIYGSYETIDIGYFYSGDACCNGFYTIDGDVITNPTHWMPLPEPPDE